jgi:hypothetical protein
MGNKDIVERFDFKHPSLGQYPTKLVFTTPSQYEEYNKLEVKESTFQSWAILKKLTFHWRELLETSKRSATEASLQWGKLNKSRKDALRALSKLDIMPESKFGVITDLESSMTRKLPPKLPEILPKPHPKRPMNLIRTPSTLRTARFRIHNHPP